MHWDFVSHPTAIIERIDAKEVIMKHGNILHTLTDRMSILETQL